MNPLKYSFPQLTKAVAALLTAVIAFLGVLATVFSTGSLHEIGIWAALIAVVLNPILVFATKAATILDGVQAVSTPPTDPEQLR